MQSRIDVQQPSGHQPYIVRVISRRDDPYAGLKGHEYIKARNLSPLVKKRVQTSAHAIKGEASK